MQTGAHDETDDVAGVSHFLEHMMFKGTPTRTAEDVNRDFDEMGAHYNAFTSEEHTVYYAAVLPEYQTAAAELLGDIIRPSLREEDFNTEKQVIIEEIRMYQDQPPFGGDDLVKAQHFGKHPLGRSVLGTIDSIAALPVDAMRKYFEHRYSSDNITLAAAGKIDFEALVSTAERICGSWQPTKAERPLSPAAAHRGFACLHKESAALEYVIALGNGPSAKDPDRYAAKLLATVLGDDSGSRLFWALVDSGLAEHCTLGHHDYQGAGVFITYMSCAAGNAQANIEQIAALYAQAEREGIAESELAQAKSKTSSRIVLSSERPRGRLFNVGGNWMQRREYRTVKDDLEAIDKVTVADTLDVLRRYPLTMNTMLAIGPVGQLAGPQS